MGYTELNAQSHLKGKAELHEEQTPHTAVCPEHPERCRSPAARDAAEGPTEGRPAAAPATERTTRRRGSGGTASRSRWRRSARVGCAAVGVHGCSTLLGSFSERRHPRISLGNQ